MKEIGLQEMWLAFGQGQNMKWIAVHELKTTLGPEKSGGILFFMPLQAVILFLHSVEKVKSQPGRHGMYALKFQTFSAN